MSTAAGARVLTPASTSVEILEHLLAVSTSITPQGAMELLRLLPDTENSKKIAAFCMGAPLSTKKIINQKLQEAGVTVSDAMSTGDTINMSVFAMLGHIAYMQEQASFTKNGLRARNVYREKIGGVDNVTLFHAGIDMGNRSERQVVLQRWATRLRGFNAAPYAHLYTRLLPGYFRASTPFSFSGVLRYIFWSGNLSPIAWVVWCVAMIFYKPYQWITWLAGPTLGWIWSFEKYYVLLFLLSHFLVPATTRTVLMPFAKNADSFSNFQEVKTFGNAASMMTRQTAWAPVIHWRVGMAGVDTAMSTVYGAWDYSKMAYNDISLLLSGNDPEIPKNIRSYFAAKRDRWMLTDTQDFIVNSVNFTFVTLGDMPLITNLTSDEEMHWRQALDSMEIKSSIADDARNIFSWVPFNSAIAKAFEDLFGKSEESNTPAIAGNTASPASDTESVRGDEPTEGPADQSRANRDSSDAPVNSRDTMSESESRMKSKEDGVVVTDTPDEIVDDDDKVTNINPFYDTLN